METKLKDITSTEDIKKLVDSFYEKANADDLLALVFNDFAKIDWESHLPVMYKFWGALLLGTMNYKGQPFPKHAVLPIEKEHFKRWIELFIQTVNENFIGKKAEEAKQRARNIAMVFKYKMGLGE